MVLFYWIRDGETKGKNYMLKQYIKNRMGQKEQQELSTITES